jgi:hypothetical protein
VNTPGNDEIDGDADAVLLFEEVRQRDLEDAFVVGEERVAKRAVFLVLERGARDDRDEDAVVAERTRTNLQRGALRFDLAARGLARPQFPGIRWRPPEAVRRVRDDEREAFDEVAVVEDVTGADIRRTERKPGVVGRELVQLDAEDGCADALPRCEEPSRPARWIEDGEFARPTRRNEGLEDFTEEFRQPERREVLRVFRCVELPETECMVGITAGVRRAGRHVD